MVLEKGLQGRGLKAACCYIQPAIAAAEKGGLSFILHIYVHPSTYSMIRFIIFKGWPGLCVGMGGYAVEGGKIGDLFLHCIAFLLFIYLFYLCIV
jgi:hypothetical protein